MISYNLLDYKSPNPDKPEIQNHKYQIPNKSQCPKFKIPNADMENGKQLIRSSGSILKKSK